MPIAVAVAIGMVNSEPVNHGWGQGWHKDVFEVARVDVVLSRGPNTWSMHPVDDGVCAVLFRLN